MRPYSTFADSTTSFILKLPKVFYLRSYAARERIVQDFVTYFSNKGDLDPTASTLIRARVDIMNRHGFRTDDIARIEAVNGFGVLLNMIPTTFWTVWHILSHADLLKAVRTEAAATGLFTNLNNETDYSEEQLNDLEVRMPVTASVMRESLRYHGSGTAARYVIEDYLLAPPPSDSQLPAPSYLLKKDTYTILPLRAPHHSTDHWGPTADSFDGWRFARKKGDEGYFKTHPAAFRGFGGGMHLCPGRVFSTRVICALVGMLVSRFEIQPAAGAWTDPGNDESSVAIVIARPSKKIEVELSPLRQAPIFK